MPTKERKRENALWPTGMLDSLGISSIARFRNPVQLRGSRSGAGEGNGNKSTRPLFHIAWRRGGERGDKRKKNYEGAEQRKSRSSKKKSRGNWHAL